MNLARIQRGPNWYLAKALKLFFAKTIKIRSCLRAKKRWFFSVWFVLKRIQKA